MRGREGQNRVRREREVNRLQSIESPGGRDRHTTPEYTTHPEFVWREVEVSREHHHEESSAMLLFESLVCPSIHPPSTQNENWKARYVKNVKAEEQQS